VLSRHINEALRIGDDIELLIVEIRGDKVRLGIEAPEDVKVHRSEVYAAIKQELGEPVLPVIQRAGMKQPNIWSSCFNIAKAADVALLMLLESCVRTKGGFVTTSELLPYRNAFNNWARTNFIEADQAADGTGYLVRLSQPAWSKVVVVAKKVAEETYGKK
jgi:carbon storage regulator